MGYIAFVCTLVAGYLGMLLDAYAGFLGAGPVLAVAVMGSFILYSINKKDK